MFLELLRILAQRENRSRRIDRCDVGKQRAHARRRFVQHGDRSVLRERFEILAAGRRFARRKTVETKAPDVEAGKHERTKQRARTRRHVNCGPGCARGPHELDTRI